MQAQELVRFLTGAEDPTRVCVEVATGTTFLEQLLFSAQKGDMAEVASLDTWDEEEVLVQKYARPYGYCE